MKRKGKMLLLLKMTAIAVFAVFIVMFLIQSQIYLNEAKKITPVLEKEVEQQEIINAGIKQNIESKNDFDSEFSEQYIKEIARKKLGLVMPNEKIFIDISN